MNPIPLPYRILAFGVLALACVGFGYVKGLQHEQAKATAAAAKAQKLAADAYAAQTERLNQVVQQLEDSKNAKQIIYRTITQQVDRVVERPVYRNVCLDDDGLRLINAAAAGKAPTDPGKPDTTMRPTAASVRRDGL